MLTDDYGNTVIVPAGFKIADDSATDVTKGVVIEDTSANKNKGFYIGRYEAGDETVVFLVQIEVDAIL